MLHPKGAMILRRDVGDATGPDGREYELTVTVGQLMPLVKSKTTGKTFALSWQDIIALAVAAGVDQEDEATPLPTV